MQITLIAVGNKMPKWVTDAFGVYQQRMPKQCQLKLVEIPAKHRGKNADKTRILRDEAAAINSVFPTETLTIALDRNGKTIDTLGLANDMRKWIDENQDIALIIGGPEGIDPQMLAATNLNWSLSKLTFAHPLVRVMVAEQIYRAWSILANLPYHRGN